MKMRDYRPEKDFDLMASWVQDERTHALWCANLIPYPLNAETFHGVLKQDERDWGGRAYVVQDESEVPVGFLAYSANAENGAGFLKFVLLDPQCRGQGRGTRMIRLLLQYAFEHTGVSSVHLNVFDGNAAAIRCYEKAGFVRESLQPGVFSFREERWGRCHMVMKK